MQSKEFNAVEASHPVLSQITELKESDVMNILNGSYIARRFFGRSRAWFSKKLNHNLQNGKPDDFTPDERKRLADALRVLSFELEELANAIE